MLKISEVRVSGLSFLLDLQTYQEIINLMAFFHTLGSLLCSTT